MGLPKGWERARIGDLCELINGRAFKPTEWEKQGLAIIRIQNLNKPEASFNRYSGYVDERNIVETGELLFAWSGTPGTSFGAHVWRGERAVLNQHIFRVLYKSEIVDRDFFRLAINVKLEELIDKAHGGVGLRHVTKGKFEETLVEIPPLGEQRRIVAKLDGLLGSTARARKELNRVPALVERFREAILERAFAGLADESARFAPLSELVDGQRGIPYGIVQTGKYFVDGVPTVRAGDIKRFRIVREALKRVEPTIAAEYERTLLRGGEVLVSIRGTVGNVAVAHIELAGCNISREVALIPPLGDVDANFLMFFIASPSVQRFLKRHTKGVAQSGVNLEDLRRLPTPVLSMEDQHEIVRRIESAFVWLDKLAAEHARAAALLPKLEQALLAKAFRGELVPQDPNDEPASALLERIRAVRDAAPERQRRSRSTQLPRAPRQRAAMTKSRLDLDVMHQPYLAKHLRDAGGSARVEDLFRSADLPVTDFYKQLAWEVEAGHVNDRGALLEAA